MKAFVVAANNAREVQRVYMGSPSPRRSARLVKPPDNLKKFVIGASKPRKSLILRS
jgi:hypothetical protein